MFDEENLLLRSGAVLRCGSDGNIWVSVDPRGGATQRVLLPYPGAGLGGGAMIVSPDETHAALYVFSGQSQQGYELFALEPELRHLGGLPYVVGEGGVPVFSPDGRWIVMFVGTIVKVHGTDEHAEDRLDPDAEGDLHVDFAELIVQALPDRSFVRVPVHTRIPASYDPDGFHEWDHYESPRFVADARVALPMPAGDDVEVGLPPRGPIAAPPWLV